MLKRKRLNKEQRLLVYNKTGGRCAYCGTEIAFEQMQIDHAVSLHNHGVDEISNMLPACKQCNYYKRGSSVEGFRKKVKKALAKKEKGQFLLLLEAKYAHWENKFYFEELRS